MSQFAGTQQFKRNVQRLNKLNDKIFQIYELLRDFTLNDWCFETRRLPAWLDALDAADRADFNCNPRSIDWALGSQLNVYGIQKFMMKMDVYPPNEQSSIITKVAPSFLQDTSGFLAKASKVRERSLEPLVSKVLYSERVQSEIRRLNPQDYYATLKDCKLFLQGLSASVDRKTVQGIFLVFHQRFRKIFDQIVVNEAELKQVSALVQQRGKAVVLVPSFKSYLDFVLLHYINIMYEIDLPFVSGLVQFSDIAVVTKILRKVGGFFVDQKRLSEPMFNLLFEEFVSEMVLSQSPLGYHIERRRERYGKIVKPIEFIFEYIVDGFLRNADALEDLVLVPVTINYDKIYEGQQFPFELLGDEGKRESVLKMLKNLLWMNEGYGRVHVKYCKPLSLREKALEHARARGLSADLLFCRTADSAAPEQARAAKAAFVEQLSMDLTFALSENLVIMATNMVAAMLLLKRHRGLSEDELVRKVQWLYDEILLRGGSTSLNARPGKQMVRNALGCLRGFIDASRVQILSPMVKANKDYKNFLMLAYYRNNLVHLFLNEALVAASFLAFGEQIATTGGVALQRVWDMTEFLSGIFRDEFLVRDQLADAEGFRAVVAFMEKRGQVERVGEDAIRMTKNGKFPLKFFSSLILPFVESYWATLSFVKQMQPGASLLQQDIEQRVQWLAETLYDEGFLIYYDACSLEPIGNAVQRFSALGLLSR